jgi:hypothetical protein
MKKILLFLMLGIVLISLVSASQLSSFGVFKQGQEIRLSQICGDATYINISSISYPNSSVAVSNVAMISSGNGEFYYTFDKTNDLGRYDVRGISDGCSSDNSVFVYYFEVSYTGKNETITTSIGSSIFFISIIVLTCLFFILGFKFSDYSGLSSVALFFYGTGFIFILYTMFLGYLFANDLGMFSGAGIQLTMFQVVATFIGLLVMGFILYVLVVSIKSWNFKKNQLSNDDGWDNGLF